LAALRAGSVMMTSLNRELALVLIREGYHVLLDTKKEDLPFQFLGLVTSPKVIKSKPQFVDNITKAIVESVAFIHKPSNKKPRRANARDTSQIG
jgi:hypothetical protein